ncbi:MAG: METTL5 family protein [Methanobrevibacter woesei]|nr:METTL5 family protein [Methanobrevibacter woesei]
MKKIRKKKQLEMAIQSIPPHPNPKVELEQYSTPAIIAADLLWNAYSLGDIENSEIIDLGCGTGILSIGSLLLGAEKVIGVDIDEESLAIARLNSENLNIEFVCCDISDFNCFDGCDVVIQNPPFGSQKKSERGADLKFIDKAKECSPRVIYSFHMASTEKFIIDYFKKSGFVVTHIFRYKFILPKIYDFHTKESKEVDVIVIRAENI